MNVLQEARFAEVTQDEESRVLESVSESTLLFMLDHGLALSARLAQHRVNLGYLADDERDLVEAMRLESRLKRVTDNVARADRRNERVRAELVGRQLPGAGEGVGPYSPFTGDTRHARSGRNED